MVTPMNIMAERDRNLQQVNKMLNRTVQFIAGIIFLGACVVLFAHEGKPSKSELLGEIVILVDILDTSIGENKRSFNRLETNMEEKCKLARASLTLNDLMKDQLKYVIEQYPEAAKLTLIQHLVPRNEDKQRRIQNSVDRTCAKPI